MGINVCTPGFAHNLCSNDEKEKMDAKNQSQYL